MMDQMTELDVLRDVYQYKKAILAIMTSFQHAKTSVETEFESHQSNAMMETLIV